MSREGWQLLIACIVGYLVVALAIFPFLDPTRIFFTQDLPTSLSVAKALLAGEPVYLGPPSHMGGRHLGPIYYWYLATGVGLSRCLVGEHDTLVAIRILVAVSLFSVPICIATLWLLTDQLHRRWALAACIATIVTSHALWVLRDPWHSNFQFLPASFFYLVATITAKRGRSFMPLFVLAASLLIQTHFSSAPAVLATSIVLALHLYRTNKSGPLMRASRTPLSKPAQYLSLTIACVSWIPLLAYELQYPSNLYQVYLGNVKREKIHATPSEAIHYLLQFFAEQTPFKSIERWHPPFQPLLQIIFAAGVSFFLLYLLLSLRGHNRWALAALVAPIGCYTVALTNLPDRFLTYYLNGMLPLAPLFVALSFQQAVAIVQRPSTTTVFTLRHQAIRLFACCFCVSLLVMISWNGWGNWRRFSGQPIAGWHTLDFAREISSKIQETNDSGVSFMLLASGSSSISREGILYEHDVQNFAQHSYADWFNEIPSAKDPLISSYDLGYFLYCPQNDRRGWHYARNRLKSEWIGWTRIDLNNCKSCANCGLRKVRRR